MNIHDLQWQLVSIACKKLFRPHEMHPFRHRHLLNAFLRPIDGIDYCCDEGDPDDFAIYHNVDDDDEVAVPVAVDAAGVTDDCCYYHRWLQMTDDEYEDHASVVHQQLTPNDRSLQWNVTREAAHCGQIFYGSHPSYRCQPSLE